MVMIQSDLKYNIIGQSEIRLTLKYFKKKYVVHVRYVQSTGGILLYQNQVFPVSWDTN